LIRSTHLFFSCNFDPGGRAGLVRPAGHVPRAAAAWQVASAAGMLLARARAVRPQTLRSSTPAPCLHLARASLACAATSDAARYTPPTCFSRGTPPAHAAASPAPQHPRAAAVSGPTRPSPALCRPRRPCAPPLSLPSPALRAAALAAPTRRRSGEVRPWGLLRRWPAGPVRRLSRRPACRRSAEASRAAADSAPFGPSLARRRGLRPRRSLWPLLARSTPDSDSERG